MQKLEPDSVNTYTIQTESLLKHCEALHLILFCLNTVVNIPTYINKKGK